MYPNSAPKMTPCLCIPVFNPAAPCVLEAEHGFVRLPSIQCTPWSLICSDNQATRVSSQPSGRVWIDKKNEALCHKSTLGEALKLDLTKMHHSHLSSSDPNKLAETLSPSFQKVILWFFHILKYWTPSHSHQLFILLSKLLLLPGFIYSPTLPSVTNSLQVHLLYVSFSLVFCIYMLWHAINVVVLHSVQVQPKWNPHATSFNSS